MSTAPASNKLFFLGYDYPGDDELINKRSLPGSENIIEWEGIMEWFVDGKGIGSAETELPRFITRVRARFEFLNNLPHRS